MTSRETLAWTVLAAPALTAAVICVTPRRLVTGVAVAGASATAALALGLAALALGDPGETFADKRLAVDASGGLLLAVIAVVGLASVLVSPAYLATVRTSLFSAGRRQRVYYVVLFAFWAALLGVPLAGNLGAAWLLIEATTAASALLVGFSGKARALEAGWKYLILTSLGLGIALVGIVMLAAGVPGGGLGALSWHALPTYAGEPGSALVAYLLLLAGLAAKIGWAPVHNWLPDAHSEAPPPVSALLSAALLPAVLLVAWRSEHALAPVIGLRTAQDVLLAFGLVSLAVAVPFLWRPMAWKRLLAYSSLEHMGVIALGIGFGTPAGPRRRRHPHRGARRREIARFLRGHATARPRPSSSRPCGLRHRTDTAVARDRSRHLTRDAGRAASLAALRERGADRRRRFRGRALVGGGGRIRAARARIPRSRACADRDHHR